MTKIYEILADAFAAEGVDHNFVLMGNGNLYWLDVLARKHGVKTYHVRHEHNAVGMAAGYARATGRVGVCSVTNGPGLAQVITELTQAARANLPLVLFAGDASVHIPWTVHQFDQEIATIATGARFIAVRSVKRLLQYVCEAFYTAKFESRPVVLSVPEDLQSEDFPYPFDYKPSSLLMPRPQHIHPDPVVLDEVVAKLAASKKPIIVAGRGAIKAGARDMLIALAEQSDALLATTMKAKGMFDDVPFDLGMAGGLSTHMAYQMFNDSDLVVGFGAGMGHHTSDGGKLYPKAEVIQVDLYPRGFWQGRRTADLHLQSDAKVAAGQILAKLKARETARAVHRTPELAGRIARAPIDGRAFDIPLNTLDPRAAAIELDDVIPKDWDVICGVGHYFHFLLPHMRNRAPERYHAITDAGAIGSALGQALGIAAAREDGKVLLVEGDGSIMLHLQELETIRRSGLKLLICIMNDGGYGAEVHKYRSKGLNASEAIHGRGNLAELASSFGLAGATVIAPGKLERLFAEHQASGTTSLWDVHIAENVPSMLYRRVHFKED